MHLPFLSLILPVSFILCWYHRCWLRPNRCGCLCHRATRWCSAATVTYFRRRLLRRRLPRRALRVYKSVLVPSASVVTDPVKVFRAMGRHIGVALLLSFHPVGLRCDAPVEDLVTIHSVEDAQQALALQPSGTGVRTYTPHPTPVEQSSLQVSTHRSWAGLFLFAPPSGIGANTSGRLV